MLLHLAETAEEMATLEEMEELEELDRQKAAMAERHTIHPRQEC